MDLNTALREIAQFWNDGALPFPGRGAARVAALESEYGRALPADVRGYVEALGPESFAFEAVGNPFDVYGFEHLARRAMGYNFNPVTNTPIEGWSDDWLLIGDEGADPLIVDLAHPGPARPVLQAMHGAGAWEFGPIADSLPQFMLLVAARHHALLMLDIDARIIDDERGFNLGEPAAQWLFPRVRRWAPGYYADWVGAFDNA